MTISGAAPYPTRMTNVPAQHLVTVWNPRYAADAMEAHLQLLLEWDTKATRDDTGADEVYVWWGKVRSNQRQQPMPHLAAIIARGRHSVDLDDTHETHLYLTDYQSLYVADVSAIVTDDPRAGDARHVPADSSNGERRPAWLGRLAAFAKPVQDHSMPTIRESIARGRTGAPLRRQKIKGIGSPSFAALAANAVRSLFTKSLNCVLSPSSCVRSMPYTSAC